MDCRKIIERTKNSIAFVLTDDGTGTAFVFQRGDVLVTCNHVIKGSEKIVIKFPDSEEYLNANILISDEEHDLALLRFSPDKVREPLSLAKNPDVKEGSPVIFSGYPFGFKNLTTHQGIISGIIKDPVGIITYSVDGSVNLGNSGGPLMNSDGEIIGVINAMRVVRGGLLNKVREMKMGAIKLHDTDLVDIFQAIISNLQLGVGFAVPASYIPAHKVVEENKQLPNK